MYHIYFNFSQAAVIISSSSSSSFAEHSRFPETMRSTILCLSANIHINDHIVHLQDITPTHTKWAYMDVCGCWTQWFVTALFVSDDVWSRYMLSFLLGNRYNIFETGLMALRIGRWLWSGYNDTFRLGRWFSIRFELFLKHVKLGWVTSQTVHSYQHRLIHNRATVAAKSSSHDSVFRQFIQSSLLTEEKGVMNELQILFYLLFWKLW